MINTIEALRGLYVALGGDISDVANVTTIPEMLTLISTVAAAAASELPVVNATDNGKVLAVVDGNWDKANAPTELPAVTGDDIGKVVSVVSDGESGAEYALETPSGGGGNSKYCFSATSSSGSLSVTMASGVTRESLQLDTTNIDLNLSAYIYYFTMDPQTYITVSLSGYLSLKNYTIKSTSDNIGFPVFDGVLYDINKPTDLYQVVFILGATAADDRLEVIKLTTT